MDPTGKFFIVIQSHGSFKCIREETDPKILRKCKQYGSQYKPGTIPHPDYAIWVVQYDFHSANHQRRLIIDRWIQKNKIDEYIRKL